MLYSISATIIDIHKSLKKSEVNVTEEIVMYIINSIIDSEKILANPDLTKFSPAIVATNVIDIDETAAESDNDNDIQNESANEESDADNDQVDVEQGDFDINDIDIEMDEEENINGNPMDF